MSLNRLLFSRIDNSPLLLFRMFFGFLVACECYGAILTGWVQRTLIAPDFTFSFLGFEWLQPLPGNGMYWYFALMGTLGVLIMLGLWYRLSILLFTVLWTGVYLMQKTSYNNHYYLLILIAAFMCFYPAQRNYSIDARRNPEIVQNSMYSWVKWLLVLQLFIVYTFAAIAKMYPDWLDGHMAKILMQSRANYPMIGPILQEPWVHQAITFFGIFFDLLVVPAMLFKPTRKFAFAASVFFHLFNSIVFQIGIFPYLSLAFTIFFFDTETIQRTFFKKKKFIKQWYQGAPNYKKTFLSITAAYFAVQLFLPLRHHLIPDKVLWTEEGHRLSWRMMLRTRAGRTSFKTVNKNSLDTTVLHLPNYLTKKQERRVKAYPDFMWQFAQRLKRDAAQKNDTIQVFIDAEISINGRPFTPFIDPKIDLANEKWQIFGHQTWILPSFLPPLK